MLHNRHKIHLENNDEIFNTSKDTDVEELNESNIDKEESNNDEINTNNNELVDNNLLDDDNF
ncbi:hypothetical protein C2G38_2200583 [Gigaspora rosea]|uniref:Uncharacterized protein n=1 Tax=Gigaspora rosea TaxID=44941 RepID=A0A397UUS3_9GLOM|nr:hypothetical protein C2G38_2200583 [Gigaspora rosea]